MAYSPDTLIDYGMQVAPDILEYFDPRRPMPFTSAIQEARENPQTNESMQKLTDEIAEDPYFLRGIALAAGNMQIRTRG